MLEIIRGGSDGVSARLSRADADAIFQRQNVLERGRIFPDPAAARAGEIAGMQWFELQDRGETLGTAQLMPDNVRSDLTREREGKSHSSEDSNKGRQRVNDPDTSVWRLCYCE